LGFCFPLEPSIFKGIGQTEEEEGRTSRGAPTGISFSISFQHLFNRAGGRTFNVLQKIHDHHETIYFTNRDCTHQLRKEHEPIVWL
jgi:hypothetical protein